MARNDSARRATIKDVAALAQVSHQTVSRYFSAPAGLKPATRASVEAAVEQLNYRLNPVARSMRTRQTGRLAVVVPTLAYSPARMLAGASTIAHDAGYAVDVMSIGGGAQARTRRVLELADSGQVDGILSFAPLDDKAPALPTDTPLIAAGEYDEGMRGVGELADATAVSELVQELARLGHRRFAHVTGSLDFASARARRDTFRAEIGQLGFAEPPVFDGDWSAESGAAAIAALAKLPPSERPTALIAGNDLVAAGAIYEATKHGWRVPEDLSVTGWDAQELGGFLSPRLTTVEIDLEGIGGRAMARLIATLRGTPIDNTSHKTTRVIWRDSTAPAPS